MIKATLIALFGALTAALSTHLLHNLSKDYSILAAAECFPNPLVAGESLTCEDRSMYADSRKWDFGDGSPFLESAKVQHAFSEAGDYTVRLIALAKGKESKEQFVYVTVRPQNTLDTALQITIVGNAPTNVINQTRSFQIKETNSTHRAIGTTTLPYRLSFKADDGYLITDHEWKPESVTRLGDWAVNIDEGGKSITVSFTLKSGPATDRYRGWVHGALETTQTKRVPESRVVLKENIIVDRLGEYSIPGFELDSFDTIQIIDGNNTLLAEGSARSVLVADELGLAFDLRDGSRGNKILHVSMTEIEI
jgi:hypothetical protein